ncbi:unnamed protein product [Tetraodon nigroviridis]|uniref:(spotted green pufferfish) hypothetical protein n=1 Tax=Tetraodon nigroviridis TaxID=99883 RepID=Q4SUY3_TETNG|nr:unnamed protein product [Tetraodon nigroviridis]
MGEEENEAAGVGTALKVMKPMRMTARETRRHFVLEEQTSSREFKAGQRNLQQVLVSWEASVSEVCAFPNETHNCCSHRISHHFSRLQQGL